LLNIVLYQPEIPPNTGTIMRLCANTDFKLHLIEPLGFSLSEKAFRRAGMDYNDRAEYVLYSSFEDFLSKVPTATKIYLSTTKATQLYTEPRYSAGDYLVFGPETRGLPDEILHAYPTEQKIKVPMTPNGRSLNLANCVSIVAYEAWRQMDFSTINIL